jgi:phasin family protein
MVDIVKRTAKPGSKPVATAKAPRIVAQPAPPERKPVPPAVKPAEPAHKLAQPAPTPAQAEPKPAQPAPMPVAMTPAIDSPPAAAFVSPQPDSPPPILAAAPSGIPVGEAPVTEAPVTEAPVTEAPVTEAAATETAVTETAASETKDAIMETIQSITDKTKSLFTNGFSGTTTTDFTEQAKGAMEKSAKMAEDFVAFGKGNIEALVESSKIAAKNVEALGQEAADYAKTSFEHATEAAKTLAAAKSPTEFMKLQSDYARTAFDTMIAEGSRSTERMLKMFGEVAQPISNRVAVATDKMKISA